MPSSFLATPEQSKQKQSGISHYIWLIALLPFLQAVMTWSFDNKLVGAKYFIRHFSMPAVGGELLILFAAITLGFSIFKVAGNLSLITNISFALWLIFAILSSCLADGSKIGSAYVTSRFVLHGLFFASVIYLIGNSKKFVTSKWLITISVGILFYVLLLFFFAIIVPDKANFDWTQRMPSATNIRQIAIIIGISTVAPIALLLYGNIQSKISLIIMISIMVTFIAWSGTRTAIICMIICIPAAMIFVRSVPEIRKIGILISCIISGCLISIALPQPNPSFGLFRLFSKIQDAENVSSGRIEFWYNTLIEIRKNPWTGYGSGNFRNNMNDIYGNIYNHPHNFALQFTYDWGLIGASAAIFLIAQLTWVIWRNAPSSPLSGFAAAAGIISMIISASVEGALFHPLPIIAVLALVAPFISELKKSKEMTDVR